MDLQRTTIAGLKQEQNFRKAPLELDAEAVETLAAARRTRRLNLIEAAPTKLPEKLFPSKTFNPPQPVKVTPVLTPDNYMDVVPAFLAAAKKSILIEQQYIRGKQEHISQLLSSVGVALERNPSLDVRIVLGKIFGSKDVEKERANLQFIKDEFGLKLGANIRFVDTTRFVHCHNKTIIVDNESVLVSSQNWSNTGVGSNREAGVLMEFPAIARYYAAIFESDWKTAKKTLPQPRPESASPAVVRRGGMLEVVYGDYAEV